MESEKPMFVIHLLNFKYQVMLRVLQNESVESPFYTFFLCLHEQ